MISKVSMMFWCSYEFHFKEQVRSNSNVPHFLRLNIIYNIYQLTQKYTEMHLLTPRRQSLSLGTDCPDLGLS